MESLVTQNVMHASLCHMTSGTFQGEYVQCHINSLKEGSFGSKKGSVPFKIILGRALTAMNLANTAVNGYCS